MLETQTVTSVDTLIEGVHFPKNTSAADIAYKALSVNLSDLAAMGAKPKEPKNTRLIWSIYIGSCHWIVIN